MKKVMMRFAVLIMLFSLLTPVNVFADGDGNIDSGGSGMGQGTSNNVWSPGNEGVRVTVVRSSDHAILSPEPVIEQYKLHLSGILDQYRLEI